MRTDDPTVPDQEDLFRRIHNTQAWLANKDGVLRPSSAAFKDEEEEICTYRSTLKTPDETLDGYPTMGLVSIKAGFPRSIGLIVSITEDPDPAHRAICLPTDKEYPGRNRRARMMADASEWVYKPPDPAVPGE